MAYGQEPPGEADGAIASRDVGACIFDYIGRIQSLHERSAVIAAMGERLSGFGIGYFGFALQAGGTEAFRRGIMVDRVRRDWSRHFFETGHAEDNPSLNGALNDKGPLYWSELASLPGCGERLAVMRDEARAFGLHEGICIPIVNPGRSVVLAAFQGRHVDVSSVARIQMYAIALFTFERLIRIGGLSATAPVRLSPREAECLTWVARGKTDWEIGEILGISETTAHWYIERAKQRFSVSTRIQAVVGAIQSGAISV